MEENLKNEQQPRLIIVTGPPEAGKTTLAESLKTGGLQDSVLFNAKQEFESGFKELKTQMPVDLAILFSKKRMQTGLTGKIVEAISKNKDFLLEAPLDAKTYLALEDNFKKAGFEIVVHFICPDSLAHCQARMQQQDGLGLGLPTGDVKTLYADNLKNLNENIIHADRVNIYDGTKTPQLLATLKKGEIIMVDPVAPKKEWIQRMPNIANAIKKHLAEAPKKSKRIKR